MKICTKCKLEKELRYFSHRTDTNKYRDQCKKCHKGYKIDREDLVKSIKDLFSKGLKECSRCKVIKSLDKFNSDKYTITGKTSYCIQCIKDKYTPDEIKNFRLKKIYNITLEDYNNMYNNVHGKCEICNLYYDKLNVDHCHITGKIRGLLCTPCNTALGQLKDDVSILKNAITYLNK